MKLKFTVSFLSFCFALMTSVSALAQEKATIKGQISLTNNQASRQRICNIERNKNRN